MGFVARFVLFGVVAVGILLRVLGLFNDLWLDEIWAISLLRTVNSWWEIVSEIHRDNNHLLTSFWNYFLGEGVPGYRYRLPSLLFSFAALPLVARLARKGDTPDGEAKVALLFFSLSYLMVLYGTEARGYSALIFFALLSFFLARRLLKAEGAPVVVLFWISGILGLLAHLTWINFYAALLIWMSSDAVRRFGLRSALVKSLLWHLPIFAVLAGILTVDARFISPGTGDLRSFIDVIVDTLSIVAGGPLSSSVDPMLEGGALICAAVVAAMLLFGIASLRRAKDSECLFYAMLLFVLPALVLISAPRVIFVRYFLVNSAFAYLLLARTLGTMWRRDWAGKFSGMLLMFLFAVGNLNLLFNFALYGRGDYRGALAFIAGQSSPGQVTIGGDQDFRTTTIIDYFSSDISSTQQLTYVEHDQAAASCPEWYLAQTQDAGFRPEPVLHHPCGTLFRFQREFPFAALSGWRWFVYRR